MPAHPSLRRTWAWLIGMFVVGEIQLGVFLAALKTGRLGPIWGHIAGVAISLLLVIVFVPRIIRTLANSAAINET